MKGDDIAPPFVKRRRGRGPIQCDTAPRLGKSLQAYILVHDRTNAVSFVSSTIRSCPDKCLLVDGSDVQNFLDGIVIAASKAMDMPTDFYTVRGFCRRFTLTMARESVRALSDAMLVKDLIRHTLRDSELLTQRCTHAAGSLVRSLVGVDVLLWSCWVCMVGSLTEDRVERLLNRPARTLTAHVGKRNVAPAGSCELVAPSLRSLTE